jgi:hypothetical protein
MLTRFWDTLSGDYAERRRQAGRPGETRLCVVGQAGRWYYRTAGPPDLGPAVARRRRSRLGNSAEDDIRLGSTPGAGSGWRQPSGANPGWGAPRRRHLAGERRRLQPRRGGSNRPRADMGKACRLRMGSSLWITTDLWIGFEVGLRASLLTCQTGACV